MNKRLVRFLSLLFLLWVSMAYTYYTLNRLYEMGEYKAVYQQLKDSIAQEKDARIRQIYFDTLLKLNRLSEGIRFLEKQLEIYPGNLDILHRILGFSDKLRDLDRLEKYAQMLLKLKPSSAYALEQLIKVRLLQNNLKDLPELLSRLRNIGDPNNKYNTYSAIYLYKIGDLTKSNLYLLKAINNNYSDSDAHLYLGYLNMREKAYFNAIEHLKRSYGNFFVAPDYISDLIAFCFYNLGYRDKAKAYLSRNNADLVLLKDTITYDDLQQENSFITLTTTMKLIPKIIDKPDRLIKFLLDLYIIHGDRYSEYGEFQYALFFYYTGFKLYGRDGRFAERLIDTYKKMKLYNHALYFYKVLKGLNYNNMESVAPIVELIKFEQSKKEKLWTLENRIEFKNYEATEYPVYLSVEENFENFCYWNKAELLKFYLNLYSAARGLKYKFYITPLSSGATPMLKLKFNELSAEKVIVEFEYDIGLEEKKAEHQYYGKNIFYELLFDIMDFVTDNIQYKAKLIVYKEEMAGFTGIIDKGIAEGIVKGDTLVNYSADLVVKVRESYDTYAYVENSDSYREIRRGMVLEEGQK